MSRAIDLYAIEDRACRALLHLGITSSSPTRSPATTSPGDAAVPDTFDWTYVIVLLVIAAITLALIAPSVINDIRDARNTRHADTEQTPPTFYTCGTRGCRPVRDQDGRFVCGTCGRPLAIREWTA